MSIYKYINFNNLTKDIENEIQKRKIIDNQSFTDGLILGLEIALRHAELVIKKSTHTSSYEVVSKKFRKRHKR